MKMIWRTQSYSACLIFFCAGGSDEEIFILNTDLDDDQS